VIPFSKLYSFKTAAFLQFFPPFPAPSSRIANNMKPNTATTPFLATLVASAQQQSLPLNAHACITGGCCHEVLIPLCVQQIWNSAGWGTLIHLDII
jgi:hypothetical protein